MKTLDALPDSARVTLTVAQLRELLGHPDADVVSGSARLAPLTVDEVAAEMGRSPSTVRGYLAAGELKGYRVGREWRVPADSVRAYYARKAGETDSQEGDVDPETVNLGDWRHEVPNATEGAS